MDKQDKKIQVRVFDKKQGSAVVTSYDEFAQVSDGYHTFDELYRWRLLYNAAFFNTLQEGLKARVESGKMTKAEFVAWRLCKSRQHSDGTEPFGGGWFVVSVQLPTGQITNHYKNEDWKLFKVLEVTKAPEWDGHTPKQAAERMEKYVLGNW